MFLETAAANGAEWFEYLKPFLDVLIPLLATAVATFFGLLLKRFLDYMKEKHGVELDVRTQARIRQTLLDGIALQEQRALALVKQGKGAPESAKKLKGAVDYAYANLKEMGLGEIPEEKIEEWVEILLAQVTQFPEMWEDAEAPTRNSIRTIASLSLPDEDSQFFLNGTTSATK